MPILLVGKVINQLKVGKKRESGFTLLELLIVMAIIAMAAAVVMTRLNGTSELTYLKAEVRKTIAKLNYNRRIAIFEGKEKLVIFQKINQMGSENSNRIIWEWNEKFSNKADYKITFYPEGGSSGGELSLSYLGHKAKIIVNPITGKIESEL